MKTEIDKPKPTFQPVSLTIRFETQAELDAFGTLCNTSPILEAMRQMGGGLPSYGTMEDLGANVSRVSEFLKHLEETFYFKKFYSKLA